MPEERKDPIYVSIIIKEYLGKKEDIELTNFNIIIIGCGGTGGNYIKELGRFLYQNDMRQYCRILLADGDLVEESNISRQPFLPQDIGRKKAEVMSEILQESFHVFCEFYTDYIESVYDLKKFEKEDAVTLLVGCVDNHACRKVLHEYFQTFNLCFYLDAANEYSVGEVVMAVRMDGVELSPDRVHYYPEIMEDTSAPRSEASCQQLNVSAPQHLLTNLFAANVLLKCTLEILSEDKWEGGIYYFDAFKGFLRFQGA